MTKELADYWSRLTDAVHPDDTENFRFTRDHGFNLDFPPPAFIGDILNAPVIILDNNGGFAQDITPEEFPDERACEDFRATLASPRPLDPKAVSTSPYYLRRNYAKWLINGQAALVNGVAYRSEDGKAPGVGRLTKKLPTALFHQKWLRDVLAPLAVKGERFVVVHRWGRWNGAAEALRGVNTAIFSAAPIAADLTAVEMAAVEGALRNRRHPAAPWTPEIAKTDRDALRTAPPRSV